LTEFHPDDQRRTQSLRDVMVVGWEPNDIIRYKFPLVEAHSFETFKAKCETIPIPREPGRPRRVIVTQKLGEKELRLLTQYAQYQNWKPPIQIVHELLHAYLADLEKDPFALPPKLPDPVSQEPANSPSLPAVDQARLSLPTGKARKLHSQAEEIREKLAEVQTALQLLVSDLEGIRPTRLSKKHQTILKTQKRLTKELLELLGLR
jgi:hypothetical protein